jgi:phosphatidylglycerol:prolipoprotein diacylglycerol transferase
MMGLGFLVGYWVIRREYIRNGIEGDLAGSVVLAAMIGGILGAKLYFWRDLASDWRELFSGSGLAWHGGLIGGVIAVLVVLYRAESLKVRDAKGIVQRRRLWEAVDGIGPAVILGQAFGRVGCFLSGDGDYGPPSHLPWSIAFPNGTVPTPPDVPVHPTMLYDVVLLAASFVLLGALRRRFESHPGVIFAAFLILMGIERVITEFWRLTRVFSFASSPMGLESRSLEDYLQGTEWRGTLLLNGVSEPQVWSLLMMVVGVVMLIRRSRATV